MGSTHELRATAFPQAFASSSRFGWQVEADLAKKQAEKEASRHPVPLPNPLAPKPVNYSLLEQALARSHRGRR
jgi:hypothetical protein